VPRAGIGYELATRFATNGFDLIVCAEDAAIVTAGWPSRGRRTTTGLGLSRTDAVSRAGARG
jgi:hypothetical protein